MAPRTNAHDLPVYQVQARNFSSEVENRIHNDELASRLGFEGALVPGVAVFGHLTRPLVDAFGSDWLATADSHVRFLKPAYHGDELSIASRITDNDAVPRAEVTCHARGQLLATLQTQLGHPESSTHAATAFSAKVDEGERVEINRDVIQLGDRFPDRTWVPSEAENLTYTQQVLDDLPIYTDGWVHPHLLLSQANTCLTHRYEMPAWIHVGSHITSFAGIRVGDEITVRAEPTQVWERKGHEFVELRIEYRRGETLTTAITHTAIFRIAGTD